MMKKEIRDEIMDIAPGLVEIGNDNPYKVPSLYFEKLEVERNVTASEKLELSENYFSSLTEKVIKESKSEKQTKIINFNVRRWTAAASVIAICMVSYFMMQQPEVASTNTSFVQDVEVEEALDYLREYEAIYAAEILDLSLIEVAEDAESIDFDEDYIDFLLDEVTLEALDELL